jgi:hypothetical protein
MLNFLKSGPLMDEAPVPAGGGAPALTETHVRNIMNEVLAAWKPPVAAAAPPVPVAAPPVPVVAPPAPIPPGTTPEHAAVLDEMRRAHAASQAEIEQLKNENKTSREQAESSARENVVVNALRGIDFANPTAAATFQRDILARVTRAANGTLVIGDMPVANVIKNELEGDYAFLVKPKNVAGSGAGGGVPANGKVPTLDDIKQGMTAETKAAVLARMKFVNQDTEQGLPWLKIR